MTQTWSEAPRYVIWEITRACNFRCEHCAVAAGRPRDDELSTEEALDVCDALADLGVPAVALMGGEVLVRRDWSQIAARLRTHGIEVGLITNGWCFDEEVAGIVERLGICQVGISLDAGSPQMHDELRGRPGAHARVMEVIERIGRLPLPYRTVITSVRRSNLPQLPVIRDLLVERASGFTWMINITSPHGKDRLDHRDLLDEDGFLELARFIHVTRAQLRGHLDVTGTHDMGYFSKELPDLHSFEWNGCAAGMETLGIRSNGDIVGCLILDDSFIEGNLRDRSLREIWTDGSAFGYNRNFTVDMLEGRCSGCEHGARCRAGCRDHAVGFTGSRFEAPFCLHRLERDGHL